MNNKIELNQSPNQHIKAVGVQTTNVVEVTIYTLRRVAKEVKAGSINSMGSLTQQQAALDMMPGCGRFVAETGS